MDNSELWNRVLEKVKSEISSLSYETWFAETKLHKIDQGIATVVVPYPFHKRHLEENYKKILNSIIIEEIGENLEFEFLIEEELEDQIEEIIPNTSNNDNNIEEDNSIPFETNLNKNYTFESFVVGNSNKFAHAAALAVAELPGETYNPLFIYGNSGLGKTHLMHAIGNYITEHSNKKVLYVTSEEFTSEFTRIVNKNENYEYMDLFKKKYRNIDVLMIDDIQFLETATKTRNEFLHTFNNLYNDKKQIIISSDRSPNDFKMFEDRLKTRFGWGLTVNIYPPDYELKIAIYKKKLKNEKLDEQIPEEVIEYMASNIGTDIREIEGSINRLLAYSTAFSGGIINLQVAVEALKDTINKGFSENTNVSRIEKIVADYFQISIEDLKSKKRNADIAFPRQIAMYLIRKLTDESFPKIGIEFGGKDHSTVMHSCEKIAQEIKKNEELKKTIEKLESEIKM